MGVVPTGDGYFARGKFNGINIWENGTIDAPFDQEVCLKLMLIHVIEFFFLVSFHFEYGCWWHEWLFFGFT